MSWRKWLVRGLVYSALGCLALGLYLYQAWTNPAAIRLQVLDKLAQKFGTARVSLESAHLRLFGGIAITDLRMGLREDLTQSDFLYIPSGILYHDKERLLDGQLSIRKVEVQRGRLRLVIDRDGRCNLAGLCGGEAASAERMPTLVLRQSSLLIEDQRVPGGNSRLEIRNVDLTLLNDPLPMVQIEGSGEVDVAGPVRIHARLDRGSGALTVGATLSAVPIGPTLIERLAGFCPDAAGHLRQLKATGRISADVTWNPGSAGGLSLDVVCHLEHGEFNHARLPTPWSNLELTCRCTHVTPTGGSIPLLRVPTARLTAASGPTRIDLSLNELELPLALREEPAGGPWEERLPVRQIDCHVEHVEISPRLFACLPEVLQVCERDYKPNGMASFHHAFRREASGRWTRRESLIAESMTAEYIKFPYPVGAITGRIEHEAASDRLDTTRFNLVGVAAGRPVTVTGLMEYDGTVRGPDGVPVQPPGLDLVVHAEAVPIDDCLIQALPPRSRTLAGQFHAEGAVDVHVTVQRDRGTTTFRPRYLVGFHDATLLYELFPYRLDKVTGVLDVQGERWECRNVHGRHGDAEIRLHAQFPADPVGPLGPGGAQELLQTGGLRAAQPSRLPIADPALRIVLSGQDVPLDDQLAQAVAAPEIPGRAGLYRTWQTLGLSGRMSFTAEVVDRPGRPEDLDVTVALQGLSLRPKFFPVTLEQIGGTARYARDRVLLTEVQAHHGLSLMRLREGLVFLKPGGGCQVRLANLEARNLALEGDLMAALPAGLARGLETLKIRGGVDVKTALIIDPRETGPPLIWWDGEAMLRDAALEPGVAMTGVDGRICCCGQHEGTKLELIGNVDLPRATVARQPITDLKCRLEVQPEASDTLRFRNLEAAAFEGVIGGEARVEFGPRVFYDVVLKALGVQLEQFSKKNIGAGADLQGVVQASVHLAGEAGVPASLRGNGRLDVPSGKLYHLPEMLDLIKAFGLRPPDRTAFEKAHMQFALEGDRLQITQLDLVGNAFSLRGRGAVKLDGTDLNLDFHADWARMGYILPPVVSQIPRALSDQLLTIKVRGRVGDVRFDKEFVPAVATPLKKAIKNGT